MIDKNKLKIKDYLKDLVKLKKCRVSEKIYRIRKNDIKKCRIFDNIQHGFLIVCEIN